MSDNKTQTLATTVYRPLIGTILEGGLSFLDEARAFSLDKDDFFTPFERAAFEAICDASKKHKSGNKIDCGDVVRYIAGVYQKDPDIIFENLQKCISKKVTQHDDFKRLIRITRVEGVKLKMSKRLENLRQEISGDQITDSLDFLWNRMETEWSCITGTFEETANDEWSGMSQYVDEYISWIDQGGSVGIQSGFPLYDFYIGGGYRPGTTHVISARPKTGKSFWVTNIAYFVGQYSNVLILDTEMNRNAFMGRLVGRITGVPYKEIESGRYKENPEQKEIVEHGFAVCRTLGINHRYVGGMTFAQILSIARSFCNNFKSKDTPPFMIYDYLKVTNPDDLRGGLKENQILGLLMGQLEDLSVRYDIPILAMSQNNREGREKAGDGIIAASDRVEWMAASTAQIRKTAPEEIHDGFNREVHIVHSRFGEELYGYIPYKARFNCGTIEEGDKVVLANGDEGDDDQNDSNS